MNAPQAAVDRWIFESHRISVESRSLFRVLYGLFVLVFAMPQPEWVATLPDVLYQPPLGPLRWLDGFPPLAVLRVLMAALCLFTCALTLGWKTKLSSLATGVLLIVVVGFEYCVGKIDHNLPLLIAVPLVMAWSGWGDRHALDEAPGTPGATSPEAPAWPVTLLATLVGLFFLSATIPKLLGGWLDPANHAVMLYVSMLRAPLGPWLAGVATGPIAELLDYAVVLFESTFLLAVIAGLRWTRVYSALAVLFHLATVLFLGIDFAEQLIVYAAFVDWQRVGPARRLGDAADRVIAFGRRAPGAMVGLAAAAYFVLHTTVGSPLLTAQGYSTAGRLAYWALPALVALAHLLRRRAPSSP